MMNGETMHTLPGPSGFPATRWTLVVAAGDRHRKETRSALVVLCETYWYPLYVYLRRRGFPADQAQDLTQEFFIRLLEGRYLDRADPEKGRFRSFLLTSLKFFVADEADRQRAQKRGGGAVVPLEFSSGEDRYQREPAHNETPERIFERRWALSVLDQVVERLRKEFLHHGRPEHFERLKVFLLGQSDAPYAALARELNTSEGAIKVAIHRLRKRYRDLFRQEIADTVANPSEVGPELRFLAGTRNPAFSRLCEPMFNKSSRLRLPHAPRHLPQTAFAGSAPPPKLAGS
jgi:RNA polymerase sigma-70 factor (ECF subfamily)